MTARPVPAQEQNPQSYIILPRTRPVPAQEQNPQSYIILPRTDTPDILVSETRTDQGSDWYNTHKVLHQEGFFMSTPRQFFDFLNLLQSPKRLYGETGKKLSTAESDQKKARILDDILAQREPWRAEHLDAYFAEVEGRMHIFYDHRTIHGELRATRVEPLEKCVMVNGYVNLTTINEQGLPTKKLRTQNYKQGKNIYFWLPINGSVAWFRADSDWVDLNCYRDPQDSDPGLGVRQQKFFEE